MLLLLLFLCVLLLLRQVHCCCQHQPQWEVFDTEIDEGVVVEIEILPMYCHLYRVLTQIMTLVVVLLEN